VVTLLIVIAAVLVALVVIALVWRQRQQSRLRGTFGSEYDRTVDDAGSKRAAVRELKERKARHDELEITPLDPTVAQRYRAEWRLVQERFVDEPAESVASAHRLLQDALAARGYPTRDDDERVAMLSVDHADVLDRYREGMRTEDNWRRRGTTETEELRQAMQHYRSVFDRVVGETADDEHAYPQDTTRDDSRDTTRTPIE
jgi:hypothetical protein